MMSSEKIDRTDNTLGARIRRQRKQLMLSQGEVARRLGFKDANTVKNYEQGRIPRGDILERLAGVLGVSSRWLLTGESASLYKEGGGGQGLAAEEPEPWRTDPRRRKLVEEIKKLAGQADDDLVDALLKNVKAFKELMERRQALQTKLNKD